MAFAGGMCVFPGGGVDPRDFDHAVAWAGPVAGGVGRRGSGRRADGAGAGLRRGARDVRGVGGAAGRDSADAVVADTTGDDWEADRVALEARELSMTEFLDRRGLVLRTDLLGAWAGWLTPVFEPQALPDLVLRRRAARGPAHPRRVHRVVVGGVAAGACDAVDEAEPARSLMLPPTYLTCLEVGRYGTPDDVLAAAAGARWRCSRPAVESRTATASRCRCRRCAPLVAGGAAVSEPWAGGRSASVVECVLAPNAGDHDARRHQHLGAARARRRAGRS